MSLRRRITAAATLAVAAVAVTVGVAGYLSTRAHLIGELHQELRSRADAYLQTNPGQPSGAQGNGNGQPPPGARSAVPPAPPLGGAPGYFQVVYSNGSVQAGNGGPPELPVSRQVLQVARSGHGGFFESARVHGIHVEVLTVAAPGTMRAIEVDLPLTSVDAALHGLLVTDSILVGAGILLAGLLGALIARAALAPIERFSERTEQVTSRLASPHRLEQSGAAELRRLATSFNQTLDALERSVHAQRNLIADASHELRTPMAALRSNIQIFLEADRLPAQEQAELQQAILAELDELTQLVADVLDLARGTGPSDHVEPIELDAVVRDAVVRTQRRAPTLMFETILEPTVIENAPERVARAVSNVIDNASKWSPPDGQIEIRLKDGVLSVRDHGPGFNEADLPHVFDRFYRADDARRLPGSGLGLSIVRQAAEAYGGSVDAANAPGGGAVLRVAFGSRSAA